MQQPTNTTEQKLLRALMQFKRLGWHQQSFGGCKPSEVRVLFCIKRGMRPDSSEMKVSEISKLMHVTSPTITQSLNSLEGQGLIERHTDVFDRRAVGVRLTERGEELAQEAADAFVASMRGLVEYLGEEESEQLADLLIKVFVFFNEKGAAYHSWHGDNEKGGTYHSPWNGDEEA